MVETSEAPQPAHEHVHPPHHAEADGFRRLAAIYVGVVAMLLAIATLGGGHVTKEMLNANIQASDTYAFAQTKYPRATIHQLAVDQLEFELNQLPALSDAEKAKATEHVAHYRSNAARYESDPASGEGRLELLAKAKEWEHRHDHAAEQNPNLEFAAALFQIAIVLGSVSIVAASRVLLGLSAVISALVIVLTINGYFLITPLSLPG